jgi:hypothetical protein
MELSSNHSLVTSRRRIPRAIEEDEEVCPRALPHRTRDRMYLTQSVLLCMVPVNLRYQIEWYSAQFLFRQ